jgi:RNA polymerase sigma-70 factor (ECF subfamily)
MAPLEPDEEKAWIRSSQQGDHAAFEALIARHQRMIHSLTFRMTGSPEEAEDLAQETFIKAFWQISAYRGDAKFSSWLYRIAINLCLNWKKTSERRRELLDVWSRETPGESRGDARAQKVQEALLKLKPAQRAAIILTTYDGLNHAEAGKALGCSETTVSWRLFAARNQLRKLLANLPVTEDSHE